MADEIRVQFVCGCSALLGSGEHNPECHEHHERRIAKVTAPPPRIVARNCDAARSLGPLVTHA